MGSEACREGSASEGGSKRTSEATWANRGQKATSAASEEVIDTGHISTGLLSDGGLRLYSGFEGTGSGDGRTPERCSAGLSGLARL